MSASIALVADERTLNSARSQHEHASTGATEHWAKRDRLRKLIEQRSFKQGDFVLSSGRGSTFLFDMKPTMLDPEGSNLLADVVLDVLDKEGIDAVGGLEMGAVLLVVGVTLKSFERRPKKAFFVRKAAKEHGTKSRIDGNLPERGECVAIVDDVTTTGGSVLKAVEAVREMGCKVDTVITIVDRCEGAKENLAQHGLKLLPLYTRDDFLKA